MLDAWIRVDGTVFLAMGNEWYPDRYDRRFDLSPYMAKLFCMSHSMPIGKWDIETIPTAIEKSFDNRRPGHVDYHFCTFRFRWRFVAHRTMSITTWDTRTSFTVLSSLAFEFRPRINRIMLGLLNVDYQTKTWRYWRYQSFLWPESSYWSTTFGHLMSIVDLVFHD